MRKDCKFTNNSIFLILMIIFLSVVGTSFGIAFLYSNNFTFFNKNFSILLTIICVFMTVITALSIIFFFLKKKFIYKCMLLCLIFLSLVFIVSFILLKFGFFEKIKSVEELRKYIMSFGKFASIIFIVIQFLQVSILPIPGFITVGAGVLLFGPLKGAILSSIGIILGSIAAFFIGKIFGYKVVCWLVGKENLDKTISLLKGKDKIILTFMFLFPFFPDDILCFVAGLSSMSWQFFVIMTIITRLISVFVSSFSMNNSIIPYDTWWGILIWILFFILTVFIAFIIYNKGDKIQALFTKKKKKKDKNS